PTVAQRPTGPVVAATADRQRQTVMARRTDGGLHLHPGVRAHDQRGRVVDGAVPNSAAAVVGLTGQHPPGRQLAIELRPGGRGRSICWHVTPSLETDILECHSTL